VCRSVNNHQFKHIKHWVRRQKEIKHPMRKLFTAGVFALLIAASGTKSGAIPQGDDDDNSQPTRNVPEAASTAMLLGCAATGLAGMRFYLRKKR
jgi:hypothetical protein